MSEDKMTVNAFVKTNTHIMSGCPIGLKIFDISRDGKPCVFDSTKDSFEKFTYYSEYEIDHWCYTIYPKGEPESENFREEKAFYAYIEEDD